MSERGSVDCNEAPNTNYIEGECKRIDDFGRLIREPTKVRVCLSSFSPELGHVDSFLSFVVG